MPGHVNAAENAENIRAELESLRARLDEPRIDFGKFWGHVKEVNSLFKILKPVENRAGLWEELGSICGSAKSQQADARRNTEKRQSVSREKRSLVDSKLRDAYHQAKGGRSASDLAEARAMLSEALGWMKSGWSEFTATTELFALNDGRMTKEDHDACWERWQEINTILQDRRREIGDYNFEHYESEVREAINLADTDPKQTKDRVKLIQEHIRGLVMTSEQFAEVRRLLDVAWQRATHRQSARHEEWRDRQLGYIETKSELIDRVKGQISDIEGQIDRDRDFEQSARTEDFAEQVRGWIDKKKDIIREKERFIDDLEEQIRDIRRKLDK